MSYLVRHARHGFLLFLSVGHAEKTNELQGGCKRVVHKKCRTFTFIPLNVLLILIYERKQ